MRREEDRLRSSICDRVRTITSSYGIITDLRQGENGGSSICDRDLTATQYGLDALKLLRENKDEYDVVITDGNMPDMDGFMLLEIVGLEMGLPVIMLSIDCDVKSVMKGIMHGAVDYLVKPVRLEELKVIWKHVARKSLKELTDPNYPSNSKLIEKHMNQRKKRDYDDNTDFDEDGAAEKKPRVTWTAELHGKFIDAINQLGLDRAVPKKILDIMNTRELSRGNVASHLQKHRRGLKKTGVRLSQNIVIEQPNGYKSMSGVSTLFSAQGPHGHANVPSSWFPHLSSHHGDIVRRYTINPQANQLGTQEPGPMNSFVVKAPTLASFSDFSYECFTPRSNQLNSFTQTSQIPLPCSTNCSPGSDQQLGYILHCQNTDMASDNNLLERSDLNDGLSVQLNTMLPLEEEHQQFHSCSFFDAEMGALRDPLDVNTNNHDLKISSTLNLTIVPAEKSSTEIHLPLNDVEYEDNLHVALKQFNS